MTLVKHAMAMVLMLLSVGGIAQTKEIMTNQEIVTKFLEGFNNPELIQESMTLLAENYRFKNPMVELNSKSEFISLAGEMGKILTSVKLINIATNGEWVSAFYQFQSTIPGLESNLATEWFRVDGGVIQESILIYDASEWRKVYDSMNE